MHRIDRNLYRDDLLMQCQFDPITRVCRACGFQGRPGRCYRTCKAPAAKHVCVHRGDQVRTQQCKTCSGNVSIKVFACALHGECELANKLKDVKRCGSCGDFQSAETNSQPHT